MRTNSRRLARFGALTLVAALTVGGPLAGAAFAGGNQGDETLATLQVEKDNVEVRKAGKDVFRAAKDEQKLEEGDTVRTDETGRAEIQYDDESYTRLDVDTTFTIESLTDDEGNRQVEGSLETGRTWNRAEGLTESESFEQSGAGATAAVQGTAFAIDCISASECDYVGAVNDTTLRANADETQTQTLLTLDLCKALSGDLCNELSKLGPGDLFDFIQECLLRDLLERGLGPGPFTMSGTIVVENGVLTFIPTASSTPASPTDLLEGAPILCDFTCDSTGGFSFALPEDGVAGSAIRVEDSGADEVDFVANLTVSPAGFFVVFTELPNESIGDFFIRCGSECAQNVEVEVPYAADTVFTYDGDDPGASSFTFHIEDEAGNQVSRDATVPVEVTPCESCDLSADTTPAPDADPPQSIEPQG